MSLPDPTALLDWFLDPSQGGDASMRSAFLSRYPRFVGVMREVVQEEKVARMPFRVLPPLEAITALQTTIHDNWPTGCKEPYASIRYGVTIQAWTCPADQVVFAKGAWDIQFLGDLRTLDEVRERRVTIQKAVNKPSDDYFDMAEAIGLNLPGVFLAMLEGKGKTSGGTVFPDHNMLAISLDGDAVEANGNILIGDTFNELAPFVTTNAAKKPLNDGRWKMKTMANGKKRRCGYPILQSRWARDPRLAGWSTNLSTWGAAR